MVSSRYSTPEDIYIYLLGFFNIYVAATGRQFRECLCPSTECLVPLGFEVGLTELKGMGIFGLGILGGLQEPTVGGSCQKIGSLFMTWRGVLEARDCKA